MITRRPSIIYDDYEESCSPQRAEKVNQKPVAASQNLKLSLDDSDMISLATKFDEQMLLGKPMYFRETNDPALSQRDQNTHQELAYPKSSIPESPPLQNNPFTQVAELRLRYLRGSLQNSSSNVKNNIDDWFLYPKPLPKYWKFEKDWRFQDHDLELACPINIDDKKKSEYYFPTYEDDRFFGLIPDEDARPHKSFGKVHYTGEYFDLEHYEQEFKKHVFLKQKSNSGTTGNFKVPSFQEFTSDFEHTVETLTSPYLSQVTIKRLEYLTEKFELFQLLHSRAEIQENKLVPHRDFYNTRKVDPNLLLSGCVSQRQLNEFIWDKLNLEPQRAVFVGATGTYTLRDIFSQGCHSNEEACIGLKVVDDEFLDWYRMVYLPGCHINPVTMETLELEEGKIKASKTGKKHIMYYMITKTFLEFDNYIEGEYFAELLVKYVVHNLEKSKYQLAQLSVDFQFGYQIENDTWWSKFSRWITRWKLVSYNIRWNIRLRRDYTKLHKLGYVSNFQEYLDFIFRPLLDENSLADINLQFFLSTVCSFDVVIDDQDDYVWRDFTRVDTVPREWTAQGDNPPVAYYMYYIYKYVSLVNQLRANRQQNTIPLRSYCPTTDNRPSQFIPHMNITEQIESLVCNMLLCQGGLLQGEPLWFTSSAVTYAYFLLQIPVVISPLSSVSLLKQIASNRETTPPEGITRDITVSDKPSYRTNPFMDMLKLGIRVILSSDSVLFNSSYTLEPIIEEYSVAASIYLLNTADLCEFVRNSVLCSGYEGWYKRHWLGIQLEQTAYMREMTGVSDIWYDNDPNTSQKHNVPALRRTYRRDTLNKEWEFVKSDLPLD